MTIKDGLTGRALFYFRDSGGKHETTPGQYVHWAITAAQKHNVSFGGEEGQIERMIRDEISMDGDIYLDYDVSGNDMSRVALDALIREAESNPDVTHIFIPRRDRLARPDDALDGMNLENRLRGTGKTLVFMDRTIEPRSQGKRQDVGEMIVALVDYDQAGKFRHDLGQKMIYAQLALAKDGFTTGGRAPFAFARWLVDAEGTRVRKLADGEKVRMPGHHVVWLPGPQEEIDLALRIRKMLYEMPASRVASILNEERIPSPDAGRSRTDHGVRHLVSGRWHQSTIVGIGRSPLYTAVVRHGLRSMGDQVRLTPEGPRDLNESDFDPVTKKPKVIRNPESSHITAPAKFEPLVDPDEHQKLVSILNQRAGTQRGKPRARNPNENPLGSRLFDMACGSSMYRIKKPKTFLYVCSLYHQSNAQQCSSNHVDGPTTSRFAMSCIRQKLSFPSTRDGLRSRLEALAKREKTENQPSQELIRCEADLKEVNREIDIVEKNLSRAQTDAQFKAISKDFDELNEKQQRLEKKLNQLQTIVRLSETTGHEVDQVLSNFDRFTELVDRGDDYKIARELFDLVNLRVYFRFKSKKLKKRTVHKVSGGIVTFGDATPPVKIYQGPTSTEKLKSKRSPRKKSKKSRQSGKTDEKSGREDESSRNVSRGDTI